MRVLVFQQEIYFILALFFYTALSVIALLFTDLIKREGWGREGREKNQFVVPLIDAFIGWFLYVP